MRRKITKQATRNVPKAGQTYLPHSPRSYNGSTRISTKSLRNRGCVPLA